jgi:hypothetical protein
MKITKRRIEAEVSFIGSGKLTGVPHTAIFGGVPKPKIGKDAHFIFAPDNPTEGSVAKQAFQMSLIDQTCGSASRPTSGRNPRSRRADTFTRFIASHSV